MRQLLTVGRVALDRYLLLAGLTAANPPAVGMLLWARAETDGRTPDRCIDSAVHTARALQRQLANNIGSVYR